MGGVLLVSNTTKKDGEDRVIWNEDRQARPGLPLECIIKGRHVSNSFRMKLID